MKIAVINSGSSSLKFKLFEMHSESESVIFSMSLDEIGSSHEKALETILDALRKKDITIADLDAVGHRVVHGGEYFHEATLIDASVIQKIDALSSLAPLHNPANLAGILSVQKLAPNLKQYAIFDTAFHATMPKEAYLYALPLEIYEKHGIRRYGFHGTSHSFIAKSAAKKLDKSIKELNIISLHLGNGASVCAVKNGQSIDTSMGFTPLEGLVMGSRSGDIDPAIVLYLIQTLGWSVEQVGQMLNRESGLKGICQESDVRKILDAQDENSQLALRMMIRRIRKYIGAYTTLLPSLDALVFTGGIGENSQYIRDEVLQGISIKRSLVINTDEELEIARQINIYGETLTTKN